MRTGMRLSPASVLWTTIAGVAAAGRGWHWADPSGVMVIGGVAMVVGVRSWRSTDGT